MIKLFRLPVVGRLQRPSAAAVQSNNLLQRDDQWQMIWVKEPLEADLDGRLLRVRRLSRRSVSRAASSCEACKPLHWNKKRARAALMIALL